MVRVAPRRRPGSRNRRRPPPSARPAGRPDAHVRHRTRAPQGHPDPPEATERPGLTLRVLVGQACERRRGDRRRKALESPAGHRVEVTERDGGRGARRVIDLQLVDEFVCGSAPTRRGRVRRVGRNVGARRRGAPAPAASAPRPAPRAGASPPPSVAPPPRDAPPPSGHQAARKRSTSSRSSRPIDSSTQEEHTSMPCRR